jgi:hypothetical protein
MPAGHADDDGAALAGAAATGGEEADGTAVMGAGGAALPPDEPLENATNAAAHAPTTAIAAMPATNGGFDAGCADDGAPADGGTTRDETTASTGTIGLLPDASATNVEASAALTDAGFADDVGLPPALRAGGRFAAARSALQSSPHVG